MFLDKLNGLVQRNLSNMLHDLLRQKGRYLTEIPFDGIGQKLKIACQLPVTQITYEKKYINKSMFLVVGMTLVHIYRTWFGLLRDGVQINSHLFKTLSTHDVRQEICTILQRFYFSSIGSHLTSQCLKQQTIDQEGLNVAYEFLLLGSDSDVASGKLKLATFFLLQNNGVLAENILQNIDENYTFQVSNAAAYDIKEPTIVRIVNENISTTDIVRYYSAFPVPYLPSETYCTPRALIPEVFRSTGSQQSFLNPRTDYWQS
ncbi:hypothetical protein ACJMK2_009634 [Sinanodonta woodiana]|uniref:Uncharacterized protein n=1 Tax=Sinanodonta woodiana TaxID=1069815 RepID=A0ABD3VEF8_SINWO